MIFWYVFLFILSFIITFFLTPYCARKAVLHDAIDKPGHRKTHKKLIPLWGGFAVYPAVLAGIIILIAFNPGFRETLTFSRFIVGKQLIGLLSGAAMILLIGALDDRRGLPPKVKLAGQLAVAVTAVFFGIKMSGVTIPFTKIYLPFFSVISIVFTIIWIVSLINAFNFVDGLDGLAAGIAFISVFSFFVISIRSLNYDVGIVTFRSLTFTSYISIILSGSLLAFLFFNFYPAKIFLGDSGAMLLGFLLASITIIGSLKKAAALALLIPIFIMGVPVLDIVLAVIRRIKAKNPVSKADREHLHHKLLGFGLSHPQVVVLMYAINAVLAGFAILIGGIK